ncbi:MAG: HAD family phosphatase, partial [Hydrogenophaga sp.]|nr:HAD family phosphatase [Hydrogenophaga sp.]
MTQFEGVLFDCDGVLVDSEPITNGVLREVLNESGWALTQAECMQIFIGKAVRDERARIEAETGQPLTDVWMRAFYARRDARLRAELQPVHGALEVVVAAHRHAGGRIACASGADRPKVVMQIVMAGMQPYFGDRIFSGHDQPRSKPAPDVYLAAAAHLLDTWHASTRPTSIDF